MDAETKNYEVSYLINPDVAEDQVFGEAGKITGFIQDARGLVGRIDEPKKRRLAYLIKDLHQAYFGCTIFTIAPEHLVELNRRLKAERNIIRFSITEEIKRPAREARRPLLARPLSEKASIRLDDVKPFTPQAPKEEDKAKIEELDKRLEEILGK
ncbi:MAG: 30S ribosomal protein S6 [Candidatus Sungbacteria bacterium]|nr:30S ribosomal protein S6 [Candidatus Sungbacteria bacterium]